MCKFTEEDQLSYIRQTIKDIERLIDLKEKGVTIDPLDYEPWCENDDGTVINHLVMSVNWLNSLVRELRKTINAPR